jgi:phosphoribosylamine--glycine ligase
MRHENLKVLIVGSGGREHALYGAARKSALVSHVLCTPGNGGIAEQNRRDVKDTDIAGIVKLAREEKVDLVIVGPEAPLVAGLVDELKKVDIAAFGPSGKAAMLEGSKIATKTICDVAGIPTAAWSSVDEFKLAKHVIGMWDSVPVIKANGLCGGRGVVVPKTKDEAIDAARNMLEKKPPYGDAGSEIVIEDRLIGRECSVMALCDGENSVLLPPARDYKRALDGDKGLNTGGMGAYSPLPDVDDALLAQIKETIIVPTLRHMYNYMKPYHGLLYAGLMLTATGPKLIEYNVRFGDPETEVVLPLLRSDIIEYMLATLEYGGLAKLRPIELSSEAAVSTVLVSDGYPGKYETGFPITNLSATSHLARLYCAGVTLVDGAFLTSGGRVMNCVGLGSSLEAARLNSQHAAEAIQFTNKFYRKDIAANV